MIYKWETLKKKAVEMLIGDWSYTIEKFAPYGLLMGIQDGTLGRRHTGNGSVDWQFGWRKNSNDLADKVTEIIMKWDIRRVKTLIELFPGIIKESCLGRTPTCYIDNNANWVVDFT